MEKRCRKCGETKALADFHKDKTRKDGFSNRCKKCQSEFMRGKSTGYSLKFREENPNYFPEYRRNHPDKTACRRKLNHALEDGRVKKKNICEVCGESPSECHHEDYSKPFQFKELCKKHHETLHLSKK